MKKKFIIAALLAGVVAATCLAGCTGNGNGGEENEGQQQEQQGVAKGVEVTAEEWTAAINASKNLQNYSVYCCDSGTTTVTGNYKDDEGIPVKLVYEEKNDANVYYEWNNNIQWQTTLQMDMVSGFSDLYALDYVPEQLVWGLPEEFREHKDKNESLSYDFYTVKINEKVYSASNYAEEWQVREEQETGDTIMFFFDTPVAIEENGEEKPVRERYSDFVYKDGVYTADFWIYGTKCAYSVSFKDGYVLSICIKFTNTEEKDGLTVTSFVENFRQFYDIGKTTVTPAPEAVKSVEDYIKEHS